MEKMSTGYFISTSTAKISGPEADTKIFSMLKECPDNDRLILIKSLDTDIIFLSLVEQAKYGTDREFYVEFGGGNTKFCSVKRLLNGLANLYPDVITSRGILNFSQDILKLYAFSGCDFNPFFKGIPKCSFFECNELVNVSTGFKTLEDLTRLLIFLYEKKNRSLRFSKHNKHILQDVQRLRGDLWAYKTSEQELIPVVSVIELQFLRSEYICEYWQNKIVTREGMETHGWKSDKVGNMSIKFLDEMAPEYCEPRKLIKGCGCQSDKVPCESSKRCSCTKNKYSCSAALCKCKCFKKELGDSSSNDSSSEAENSEEELGFILMTDSSDESD